MNPLDVYKSYTYHFELHVATTWDELQKEVNSVSEDFTTPNQANGTLLINTRKDAHQTIDNVRYMYQSPRVDPTGTTAAIAELHLTITEPNGTFFIEKLESVLRREGIVDLQRSAIFMLKIVFVGRHSDNSIAVDELPPICIPLYLANVEAEFSYKGGTYAMLFVGAGAGVLSDRLAEMNNVVLTDGYSHKNVAIKARTVREALEQLQSALQRNYDETYQDSTSPGRPLRYSIELDPKIDGDLDLVTKETWSPGDYMKITFQPEVPIIEMIKKIVMSSKRVNEMIASSSAGIRKEFHPNVAFPVYSLRYNLLSNEAVLNFDVKLYEGRTDPAANVYEFDFLFATPAGKNVDVINFEMKYKTLYSWIQWSLNNSVSYHTNQDNETSTKYPGHYSETIVTPNKKASKYVDQSPSGSKFVTGIRPNDVKPSPATNNPENAGHVHLTYDGAQSARLAFNTIGEIHGAVDPMLTFTIRGHYQLLLPCIPTPDGQHFGFGVVEALWAKVNIKNHDGQDFFYKGYYEMYTIENIFENGMFVQNLTVVMKERDDVPYGTSSIVKPTGSAYQPSGTDGRGESSKSVTVTRNGGNG